MIKKFVFIIITTCALTLGVNAASDGDLILKKMTLRKLRTVLKLLIELHLH